MSYEEERFYLNSFAKVCPIRFEILEHRREDVPDFLVLVDKKIVGIEMTEYILPRSKRSLVFRENIIESAEKRYQELSANSTHSLTGSVYVNMRHDIDVVMKKERLKPVEIAARFARFVFEFKGQGETEDSYLHHLLLKEYGLEKVFYQIVVHHEPNLPLLIWHKTSHAYRSADLCHASTLQALKKSVMPKKEGKLSEYLKYCEECWLLIVGGGGADSPVRIGKEDVSETEKLSQRVFNDSLFEKIFFFDTRWIVNLK